MVEINIANTYIEMESPSSRFAVDQVSHLRCRRAGACMRMRTSGSLLEVGCW